MGKKKKVLTLRNDAGFARHYRNTETGEVVTLHPGLNPGVPGKLVERLVSGDKRFETQINEDRGLSINEDRSDALERLIKAVENADMSIADVAQVHDALLVVGGINSKTALLGMYREARRVSVRNQIVRKLRLLGYTGT